MRRRNIVQVINAEPAPVARDLMLPRGRHLADKIRRFQIVRGDIADCLSQGRGLWAEPQQKQAVGAGQMLELVHASVQALRTLKLVQDADALGAVGHDGSFVALGFGNGLG